MIGGVIEGDKELVVHGGKDDEEEGGELPEKELGTRKCTRWVG